MTENYVSLIADWFSGVPSLLCIKYSTDYCTYSTKLITREKLFYIQPSFSTSIFAFQTFRSDTGLGALLEIVFFVVPDVGLALRAVDV